MRFWGLFGTGILTFSLVGCVTVEVAGTSRAVGNCWEISAGAARDVFLNEGLASSQCGEDSVSATYYVGEVEDAPEGGYLSDLFLEAKLINDLPESMHQDLINDCQVALKNYLGFDSISQLRKSRIVWDFTLPNHNEWQSGERWFSCEMSVLEKGSQLVEPVWMSLNDGPNTVKSIASTNEINLCFDTATNSQLPSSRLGIVSSCSDARWKLEPIPLENGYGEFFPGTKEATSLANKICATKHSQALKTYASPVMEEDWNSPQPTIQCWYSIKEDPASAEALAAEEARIAAEQEELAQTAARQAAQNRAWREYLAEQESLEQSNNNQPEPDPSPSTEPDPDPSPSTEPDPDPSPSTEPDPDPSPSTEPEPDPSPSTEPEPDPPI